MTELTTSDGSTGINFSQVTKPPTIDDITRWRLEDSEPSWAREFKRQPEIDLPLNIAAGMDAVGEGDDPSADTATIKTDDEPQPSPSKSKWKKPRSEKRKPKPLRATVTHLTIYANHHRNQECWSKAAILSEIDCLMKTNQGPCFASAQHLAAVGKVVLGTAQNYLAEWDKSGVLVGLGYHGRTKNRVVHPDHSTFPKLSKRIIDGFKNREKGDAIPF